MDNGKEIRDMAKKLARRDAELYNRSDETYLQNRIEYHMKNMRHMQELYDEICLGA